ncbi:universal stress protein [Bradyrhizobium sp.]|jgi:nucleotide-binding universal stress UspA family protein|uniref:universal stress protein n=1 Tax=Bradyrhizobium sp. TaxID=376 RepID=UPI003C16830D
MPFKSIAVLFEPTPSGEARAAYAARLAHRHGAHLVGIFMTPPLFNGSTAESLVQGHKAVREVIVLHKAKEAEAIEHAKRSLCAVCRDEGIGFEFRALSRGDFGDDIALNSLHADLVIACAGQGGGLPLQWSPEALLLATGVPFILLPESWNASAVEHVVVAWNASREARRAISDALPLLVEAKSVTILLVDAGKNPRHGEEPGADIAHYLSRHGAKVSVKQTASRGEPIAKVILDHAREHAADLIVIGAYSRARTAQMIFGGITRSLLRDAGVPLLIAH